MFRQLCVPAIGAALVFGLPTPGAQAEYQPIMELTPAHGPVEPMKNKARIEVTGGGLRFIAGQQNSRLTITEQDGKLLFVDTGTAAWKGLAGVCQRVSVATGVGALCSIPSQFAQGSMYLEVWPRLGNDHVNGSTLGSKYRMWVLADQGRDTVLTGAGDDFVNGATHRDKVWGGAGDDWIRTGKGNDQLWGQEGNDKLVGVVDDDQIHGGPGDDKSYGGPGNDALYAEGGRDLVMCAGGVDRAYYDSDDKAVECE